MQGYFKPRRLFISLCITATYLLLFPLIAAADLPIFELVPGTAVLLTQASSTGSGTTSSGQTASTTSSTNIFAPPTYVDIKRHGGEPTVSIDRYPFQPGPFAFGAAATSYKDLVYVSAPEGVAFPGYSVFWKSSDNGQTYRVPTHDPYFGRPSATNGGGDSHQVVGPITHSVFFLDLPGGCVDMNVSRDLGETFTTDDLGCGANPGAIDDRQWVDVDETFPGFAGNTTTIPPLPGVPASNTTCLSGPVPSCGNVYVSFINFSTQVAPSLALARSTHDGAPGTFVTDSLCNFLTQASTGQSASPAPTGPATDNVPTVCPDPTDNRLMDAGPVVVDRYVTHNVYIPFIRGTFDTSSLGATAPYSIWVAKSTDGGSTWTRNKVADTGARYPGNIFTQMTIDRAGNLYSAFILAQGAASNTDFGGETDAYYTYSTNQGVTWAPPVDITPEKGDSVVFPWIVAGDPGQVDYVFYKSNTGLNPNVAAVDQNGNPSSCDPTSTANCFANPSIWNVYFSQSQNALNQGANFKTVQISERPNHYGQICTSGLNCDLLGGGNRNLSDFFTVDVDHLGAAIVSWTDDNNSRNDTRVLNGRQISGNSVFKSTPINLQQSWPIQDHTVYDPASDVFNADGLPVTACPGMDILAASTSRSGDILTASLTLNAPPSAATAITCSGGQATGGLWGIAFWASSVPTSTSLANNDNFYLAYRDNPGDVSAPTPEVEAGTINGLEGNFVSNEFKRSQAGTLGGTCFSTPAPTPCTITLSTTLSTLGIKQGAGLYSITGFSVYMFGTEQFAPLTRLSLGFSQIADLTAALDDTGTGTTK